MNGALFAAFRVLENVYNMVSCSRTNHGVVRQLGISLFMIYYLIMQLLSFFMIGSFYVSIKLFFLNYFGKLAEKGSFSEKFPTLYKFFENYYDIGFAQVFSWGYISLLVFSVLISLAVPIDRAMSYFRLIAFVFAFLTIFSLVGISVFLAERKMVADGEFQLLTLAGVIMLSTYLFPIFLRPLDFLFNIKSYFFGFIAYMLMIPTFTNVM